MTSWLHKIIDLAAVRGDIDRLRQELALIFDRAGFDSYVYLNARQRGSHLLSNACAEWQALYLRENYTASDPLIALARGKMRPFSWDVETLRTGSGPAERMVLTAAERAGLRHGLSIPVEASFGHVAILSGISAAPMAMKGSDLDPVISATAVSQLHARLETDKSVKPDVAHSVLSAKQALCLRWSAEGKSMRAIAMIENMPYANVVFHLNCARNALDALSLAQATAIATKLELI